MKESTNAAKIAVAERVAVRKRRRDPKVIEIDLLLLLIDLFHFPDRVVERKFSGTEDEDRDIEHKINEAQLFFAEIVGCMHDEHDDGETDDKRDRGDACE